MEIAVQLGRILKELRETRGLSQEKLASLANLDRTYISLLERGLRQATLKTLFSIAEVLQTAPSTIVARLENQKHE